MYTACPAMKILLPCILLMVFGQVSTLDIVILGPSNRTCTPSDTASDCGPDECCRDAFLRLGSIDPDTGEVLHFPGHMGWVCAPHLSEGDRCIPESEGVVYLTMDCGCGAGLKCRPDSSSDGAIFQEFSFTCQTV